MTRCYKCGEYLEPVKICYRCGEYLEPVEIPTTHKTCEEDAAFKTADRYWREREGISPADELASHDESEVARVVEHFRPVFRRADEVFAGLKRAVESLEHGEAVGPVIKQANRVLRKQVAND